MANVYVRSGAAGAGTGADWANAYTTLAAALTAKAAGDSFWVSEDHAETQASAMTLTSPGTNSTPCFIYCVSHTGTVPPVSADLATTATITTTGNNSITTAGTGYCYGVIFNAGNSTGTASINVANNQGSSWKFKSCALKLLGSGASSKIALGAGGAINYIELDGTTVQFGSTFQSIFLLGVVVWRNTASAISGATLPLTLFNFSSFSGGLLACEGVDLSALGSGKTLVSPTVAVTGAAVTFKDCKLGASVTVSDTPSGYAYPKITVIRCDSGATNYRHERYDFTGTQTVETTIVRTGGASDGTTTITHKIVTTADSKWVLPFEALPIAIWNDSTSSVTVTVYGIWGGGAVPNNDDIWMDVEYLGSALTPQGSFATSTKADNLATASALTTDTSTWGGSTTKFKMTATFTPAQKGAIYIYVKAAKLSSTFYIDPKPVLS